MNKLFSTVFLMILFAASPVFAQEDHGIIERDGHLVRILPHPDGSKSFYMKDTEQKGMRRTTYDARGVLVSIIVYATGKWDHLTSCKVYDGGKRELYKVAYGYDKDARLMEEQMFDSNRIDPKTGKNLLVRRFIYTYDSSGNRSKPICIVVANNAEYDKSPAIMPTAPERDPFAVEPKDKGKGK